MEFRYSAKTEALRQRVADFMAEHIYPNEQALFHTAHTQANQWKPPSPSA